MENLKEEIHAYWTNRAAGYSEYNQQELLDERHQKWKNKLDSLIREQFPTQERKELHILDVGTGPGFFSLILAELGYEVSALDCTQEMLEEAKKNAGEYADEIHWYLGDAQELEELDGNRFDVLVTRNVTWNLENPEKAYAQWLRVLKPGGVLFNFDADWYGYLFDEEKRKGYEEDRKNITEQGAEDLNAGTGVNMDAMEQIARQVPLSRMNRPEWDVETMRHAGYEKVFYDPEVWREVWGKDDIINGGSTPMFLLTGKKAEAESGPFLQKLAGRE
ncbi:MAG: class I SAM-dependent methyltransferase, partial [Blautia sp.]|nr:class I SAM-dependent methyltransferase [Blautia sp.]